MRRGLSAFLLLGCDAVLGIRDLPRERSVSLADTGIDAEPPPNVACLACEAAKCGSPRLSCTSEPACSSLYRCLSRCAIGDIVCRARCEQSNAIAAQTPVFAALDVCRRRECAADCYGSSGFGSALSVGCACMNDHCAKQMLSCVASGACDRRLSCLAQQPNPDGWIDCIGQFGGAVEADALLDCMRKATCTDPGEKLACPIGEGVLSCTGAFIYGRSRAPDVSFGFGVEDFSGVGVAGATVTACNPPVCAKGCKGVSAPTRADGRVVLQLPMSNGGFDGCVRVDPPVGSDYMPVSVMTGRRVHLNESSLITLALQESLFSLYAVQAGVELIAGRGHVIVSVHDCVWGRVAGASLNDLGGGSTRAYLDGVNVVPGGMATTATGAAAYVNVQPGTHELVVTKGGRTIARQSIVVHKGELTDANIYPLSK